MNEFFNNASGQSRTPATTDAGSFKPTGASPKKPARPHLNPSLTTGQNAEAGPSTPKSNHSKVKRDDIILLVNQLAVMLDTGVPLSEAIGGIANRTMDPKFRAILVEVTDHVESGQTLSSALAKYPRAFPPVMIALLRASEASGTMSTMLNRIATYLTKEHLTAKQVKGALIYPAFMILMCISVTVFLLTVVLPRFAEIYSKRGAALPAPTQFLMTASDMMIVYWPFWVFGSIVIGAGLIHWQRTATGRVQIDWLKLNIPIFSNIFNKLYLTRSCQTIGTMIATGVSLLETVTIARDVTHNTYYERLWDRVDEQLRQGMPLSDALYESPLVPDHIAQMIESGEKSGRLSQVFTRVAEFTEEELDQAVKTTTQFIEPVMILTMGLIIGFVAVALLIPMFTMGKVVAGG